MKLSIREKLDRSRRVLDRRDPRPEALEEQLRRDLMREGGPRTAFLKGLLDARAFWRDYRALVEAPNLTRATGDSGGSAEGFALKLILQFAEKYPDKRKLGTAVQSFKSWTEVPDRMSAEWLTTSTRFEMASASAVGLARRRNTRPRITASEHYETHSHSMSGRAVAGLVRTFP